MQRRAFLAATGVTTTMALAGCSGGGGSDDGDDSSNGDSSGDDTGTADDGSDGGDDSSGPDYDTEAAVQALRSYITAEELSTARNLLHTRSTAEPSTVGEIVEQEYSVLEENISRERLGELLSPIDDLDDSDLDAIAEGVVLLVEASVTFEFRGEETSDTQQWVLARENGEWKVVERAIVSG
jgi:hypothetical protein